MAHKLVDDAIVRYHKILDSQPYQNLEWAETLADKMREAGLSVGARLSSPFLRPHFLTSKQYEQLGKSSGVLAEAVERLANLALSQPNLLQRLDLLPAERMLAALPSGYKGTVVATAYAAQMNTTATRFTAFQSMSANSLAQSEMLAELLYEAGPVKEFRKKYALTKLPGMKPLVSSILKAWKSFGGKTAPRVALVDLRQPFQGGDPAEGLAHLDLFRKFGLEAMSVAPEQLDYRAGALYAVASGGRGEQQIDVVYRTGNLQDFLQRFDLNHPLIRAYRDGRICVVNSFRAELTQKRSLLSLLTDATVTGNFPAVEKKAIAALVPWTRTLNNAKTERHGEIVDLPEYVSANKDQFVLLPNDPSSSLPTYEGLTMEQGPWDRALKQAQRERYVVQDRLTPVTAPFPVLFYGSLEMRELQVNVEPQLFLGEQKSLITQLTAQGGFSTMQGIATTYLLK